MANVKISELPAGVPANGSLIPGVVGGVTQAFAFSTSMAGLWGAADYATMRALLGAGTSNIELGTTAGTALAGNGNAATATSAATLTTARTVAISGDVTGTATPFNGSANIIIPATITAGVIVNADVNAAAAIAASKLSFTAVPGYAATGTFNLQMVDGVLTWTAAA